jgi:Fic family protein
MDKIADNSLVKKVMTFKAGQFVFSRNFDRAALERLFIEARVLKQTVADLPVLPWLASRLDEETIRRAIHSTAAIEGNPLSEEQVGEVLARPEEAKTSAGAEQEIRNLREAYKACRRARLTSDGFRLEEPIIKAFHQAITMDIAHEHNVPGRYRDHLVKVGDKEHGGVYTPPKILKDVQTLMTEFIAWINGGELMQEEPPVRAALAHYHLGLIHPFGDGNGRAARLVEALVLQAQGIGHLPVMLSNYYYTHVDDYYWAFTRSQRGKEHDVTPFVEFVLKAFIAALYELKSKMTHAIRKLAMRDFLVLRRQNKLITQRQHDLLVLLLDSDKPFSLADLQTQPLFQVLYRAVSERTARRDIQRLLDHGLLLPDKPGQYRLNLRGLDRP